MRQRITNTKTTEISIVIGATQDELDERAFKRMEEKGWDPEDCIGEEVKFA